MNRKKYDVFLDPREERILKEKARSLGLEGRGWLSKFVQMIAVKEIAFLDDNLKKVLGLFKIS